ncbi:MAG: ISAzo13 family transposase [Terriglobia bacterium]
MNQLRELLREETAGDPTGQRGLWTGLRLEQISGRLKALGLGVCPNTVRRLLDQLGYALHANRKSLSGPQSPERDSQFRYIQGQRQQFTRSGLPIISVDTKKKELVGSFKNAGRIWSREPLPVNDHDFRSQAKGIAIPRGLYDVQANRGAVLIGTSHDTPEFAADAIVDWWRSEGRRRYPQAQELLILADSGGSNGARCRLWKHSLQEKLVDPYQIAVTVCHYPTGTSKWNPIEHRLFSEISKHWAGQPLSDYIDIVRLVAATRTKTGLEVTCALSEERYATHIKVSDIQMRSLDYLSHPTLPQWNYTLLPTINRN